MDADSTYPVALTAAAAAPARPRAAQAHREAEVAARALTVARRTAYGVLGNHASADDVAQEVAIAAVRGVGRLRHAGALDGWLHRMAVRAALKEAARTRRRAAAEAELRPAEPLPPAAEQALSLLDVLPDRQRAAVVLRYVHDLTDAEIGKALGCRTGTVRSLLSRARRTLRAELT